LRYSRVDSLHHQGRVDLHTSVNFGLTNAAEKVFTMARGQNKNREGAEGLKKRETQKGVDGKQANKESRKARRGKKRGHTNVEIDQNSDIQPAKKAKVYPGSNKIDHVSHSESNDGTTSNPKNCTKDTTKDARPTKPAITVSSNAPPIYGDVGFTHDISQISILTSTKIEKKVSFVLEKLAQYPAIPPSKPAVVFLHSKAVAASKLITIVEIAKREIAAKGGKWFQYNALSQLMEERKRRKHDSSHGEQKESMDVDRLEKSGDEEEEGDSFEVMKTPFERAIEGTPKVRAVPIMAIYLSRVRIESLRKKYG
jgi:hypothetical protein